VIVSTLNRWRKRRSRPNVQSWELSSQGPPDAPLPEPDVQQRAAAHANEGQDALDADDSSRVVELPGIDQRRR